MPRKKLQRTDLLPYHVTARANNRDAFLLPLDKLWEIMGKECLFLSMIYEVKFHSLVLMPNHFHTILTVPKHDLGVVMNELLKSVSRIANTISGRSGHVFGGPYHWSLIGNSRYYGHAYKYVYRNPVKAKLTTFAEEYPYSTLQGLLGQAHLPFPIHFTQIGMEATLPKVGTDPYLKWLNTPFLSEAENLIQKALRRKLFDIIIDRKTIMSIEQFNLLL